MKNPIVLCILFLSLIFGCQSSSGDQREVKNIMPEKDQTIRTATFAGGCFWCSEADFEKIPGVVKVTSGYTGGFAENPSYEQVSSGKTGHVEAVQVLYEPSRVGYEQLLDVFWRHIDPTDPGGQFADRGSQYRSAIYYHDEEQKMLAEKSRKELAASGRFSKPIVTEIVTFKKFYEAEDYHQEYSRKNPLRYKLYRKGSGRDRFLENTWGGSQCEIRPSPVQPHSKPDERTLRDKLTPMQYSVTRQNGTEPPFKNEFWDNKREGIYVDVVSGEPLFSSLDKFDSGTGWPSFTRPVEPDRIVEKEDRSHFTRRTEVRSKDGDSHLGHVFPDGPGPTGLRYCINSAALKFIPREDMEKEGYGKYLKLFDKK